MVIRGHEFLKSMASLSTSTSRNAGGASVSLSQMGGSWFSRSFKCGTKYKAKKTWELKDYTISLKKGVFCSNNLISEFLVLFGPLFLFVDDRM